LRPKAAVAANTGAGPDIILSTNDDANLYPDKLLDVSDVCDYLGKKYGGWYPACETYLKPDGKKWIGVPLGASGAIMVYRQSLLKAAGINSFPKDVDGYLKMFQALQSQRHTGRHGAGQCHRRQWLDALADLGFWRLHRRQEQQSGDQQPANHQRLWSTPKSCTPPLSLAPCRG
jgi:multiple sugar transport system substrate-binding protein